jgi:hypothetical protein
MADTCGLYLDLADPFEAVAVGDWVATEAGARYLVVTARKVHPRLHAQRNRWQMTCLRLDRDRDVPADVHCWWVRWYSRPRR